MSAYLCSPDELSALVSFASAHAHACGAVPLVRTSEDKLFKLLMRENQRALEHKYGPGKGRVSEWYSEPIPLFCYRKVLPPAPAQVVELCGTYDYQACEHPEYDASPVRSLIATLKAHAQKHIAEAPKPPACVPCALCGKEVSNDPERTLAHLDACEAGEVNITRDDAIKRIRAALKRRSGKAWSVKGGRGTAWGWIRVSAPPARCGEFGYMSEADTAELAALLGNERMSRQGESIAAGSDYYREYVARAEGREPTVYGKPYWD